MTASRAPSLREAAAIVVVLVASLSCRSNSQNDRADTLPDEADGRPVASDDTGAREPFDAVADVSVSGEPPNPFLSTRAADASWEAPRPNPLEGVLDDYSTLAFDVATRKLEEGDAATVDLLLNRALLYAPESDTDETLRSRIFFALGTGARLRGDAQLATNYDRASYLLSALMSRPAYVKRMSVRPTLEDVEAKARMGSCPLAVLPFDPRTFADRESAVSFLRAWTRRVARDPSVPETSVRAGDGGLEDASFVSVTIGDTGDWWFALLPVSAGVTIVDTRTKDATCGPVECSSLGAHKNKGVWQVATERRSFGLADCECGVKGEREERDSCDGCPGPCACEEMPHAADFGPHESFFVEATSGAGLWHVLAEQSNFQLPVDADTSSLHVHARGCRETWPAPTHTPVGPRPGGTIRP